MGVTWIIFGPTLDICLYFIQYFQYVEKVKMFVKLTIPAFQYKVGAGRVRRFGVLFSKPKLEYLKETWFLSTKEQSLIYTNKSILKLRGKKEGEQREESRQNESKNLCAGSCTR